MAQEKEDTSFRVIDRRLFTQEGELRPDAQAQEWHEREEAKHPPQAPAGASPSAPASAQSKQTAAEPAGAPPVRSPHFEMLLNLIANQAAAMMGAYADPRTGQAVVDLEGAREFIDMLDALREKTRGNLAPEEDSMLAEVLGSLKYTYLEMIKAAAAARAGGAVPGAGTRR